MKKVIYLLASALFCLNAEAQYSNKQSVADFNAIEVGSAARITLVQSDTDYIVLTSKMPVDKMHNIEVEDGVLKITSPVGGNIEVHVKNLRSIKVNDAAKVTCTDTLKADNLSVHVSDAGYADILVHAKMLKARSNDASRVTLSGTADSLDVKASDGAHIKAADLKALNVHAISSDGSNVSVWAVNSINANATDGSDIHVKGTPVQKNTNAADGGSVSMGDTVEKPVSNNSGGKKGFNIDKDAFIGMGFVMGGTKAGNAYSGSSYPNGKVDANVKYGSSREFILGFGHAYNLAKWNALGWDVYYKSTDFYLNQDSTKTFPNKALHQAEKLSFQNFGGLIYDRFYIGRKIFLDGGIYGDWTFHSKWVTWDGNSPSASSTKTIERNFSYVNPTNYGVMVRFGMTKGLSVYFNYRVSNLFKPIDYDAGGVATPLYMYYPELPAYTIGITLGSF
jgi:Putative auto-transporter adhesin, head GIN domain